VPGYVFVSYSRTDKAYVRQLVIHLRSHDLSVWFDEQIPYGDRFDRTIAQRIDWCSAFVLVMTPASYESSWIAREVARAEQRQRVIVPLLLAGDVHFRVNHINFVDVSGGRLPGPELIARLIELQGRGPGEPLSPVPPEPVNPALDTFEQGKAALFRGAYQYARECFVVCLADEADVPDLHYYFALALLGGVRPGRHRRDRIRVIEDHLGRLLAQQPESPHACAVWAIVKEDYYRPNGFSEVSPTAAELSAEVRSISAERASEVIAYARAPASPTWQLLVSLFGSSAGRPDGSW
jgi:hypothetical protein